MNRFELFCLIFFALDAQWDNTPNEALGDFLSSANPFLFAEIGSAIPEIYETFCSTVQNNSIELNASYGIAKFYIERLAVPAITEAFLKIDETQWLTAARKYLSTPHKGENLYA